MAYRITDWVLRGEIDNRIKGVITGKIWISGREEPLCLQLTGNAHPDLAGCFLKFENPEPEPPSVRNGSLLTDQTGVAGDLTASRKCRTFDVPVSQALEMSERGEKPPEHLANVLYLEWFSKSNGRVVIEGSSFKLSITAPEWSLTPEEEGLRAQEAEKAFKNFLDPLTRRIESSRNQDKGDIEDWDEFDHEKALRDSDAVTDKYAELLEKYGDSDEAELIIAREMGWKRLEEMLQEQNSGEDSDWKEWPDAETDEELEPDPATEGVDWVKDEEGEIQHPLAARAFRNSLKVVAFIGNSEDARLQDFGFDIQMIGAKLAGALNTVWMDRDLLMPGFTVATLKRVLPLVHQAQKHFLELKEGSSLEEQELAYWEKELAEVREEILRLMEEFRKRSAE